MKTITNTTYSALALCGLVLLAFSPAAQAVSPAPDGGYPGGNTAEGQNALFSLTSGGYNTAVGFFSLRNDTTGSFNTGFGAGALFVNTADQNTAIGAGALLSNSTGTFNTANGALALAFNTTGQNNSAFGWGALNANTTADYNTACGFAALYSNTIGTLNTAIGDGALYSNTTGSYNTATGTDALYSNVGGGPNTAVGYQALYTNNGGSNTAVGYQALYSSTGFGNTATGGDALYHSTGNGNTAIGYNAGSALTTADNVICIGQVPGDNVSNSCFIDNIWNQPGGSQAVYVNSDGKLGYQVSSRRFKDEIRPMEQASEVIYNLKPVSFRYKPAIERTRQLGFGLIAEDVEKVSPHLVTRDGNGRVNSVRYDAVSAMLLNEFLKEHRKIEVQQSKLEEQEATIAQLKTIIETMVAHSKQQDSEIAKVRDQVQITRSDAQLAITNH